ncbi:MAG: hypothetical protein HQL66_02485 [Magnetococcales bacterium]|nr:hypothetical protein [Magnetococcales bacterium]
MELWGKLGKTSLALMLAGLLFSLPWLTISALAWFITTLLLVSIAPMAKVLTVLLRCLSAVFRGYLGVLPER